MFELGWGTTKQAVGTPIKKLLAKEMSKETESKRRSPSVIAKLMGLDGLPPPQPAQKQQRRSSEHQIKRKNSVDKAQKSGKFDDRCSSRRSSKDQQEFKDVFEVFEPSKLENSHCSLEGASNSKLTDAEMEFIRQKFIDAKRLSSDQKLQDSKEFHEALEVLDSNKDHLLKFLQQPDSLFTKHLHDLHGAPVQTHCGRVAAMKLPDAQKYESSEFGKSQRRTPWKNYSRSPQNHCGGLRCQSDCGHTACNSLNSSKVRVEGKNEVGALPTSIVVLKPNVGKAQMATKPAPSPCSSHTFLSDCRVHAEFPNIKNRAGEPGEMKNFSDKTGPSRHKSRESREIAREITKQMRNSLHSGSMNFSSGGFKGYAGDESSCDMSGTESDAATVTSRNSFDLNRRYKPSSSRSAESSVSREAKKRLSERWKMTHKSEELALVCRGSTLAEMLAIPVKDTMPENLGGMSCTEGNDDKFASDDGPTRLVEPLGISSRDGWKGTSNRNLSRSRSLPASSSAFGSPKTSKTSETLFDDRNVMTKEALKKERIKRVKDNSDWRELSAHRNSRSSRKKSHSFSCTGRGGNECFPEIHTNQDQLKTSTENVDPTEKYLMIDETLVSYVHDRTPVPENVVDVENDNMTLPSELPDEMPSHVSTSAVVNDDISAGSQDILCSQETLIGPSKESSVPSLPPPPGLESPVSSKEADQPSPVSVLEAPFMDDVSSCSDCFETLSADLHGLRMQLQLLKLESDANAEGSMVFSSDDDVEGSVLNEKRVYTTEDGWEPSYIVDVLTGAGFNDADPDMVMATRYSSECPVDPLVFEELEKKHRDQTSCSRSERRLLFDRVNYALVEIFQQFMDPHPWVTHETRIGSRWVRDGLHDRLHALLLVGQEKKSNKDTLGKVLAGESQWVVLRDDINEIGEEIERLLTDELVAEVVFM